NRTAQASRGHTETMPEQRELKAHARKDNGFSEIPPTATPEELLVPRGSAAKASEGIIGDPAMTRAGNAAIARRTTATETIE
ncbi:hypothetical protein ACFWMJ_41760, partial [Streptomyces hawaiiensis]|uniref:hypothetical protein n=1 Tax=Streptomyces hawaiiensis TaxID=67305 RepID=UPI0036582506